MSSIFSSYLASSSSTAGAGLLRLKSRLAKERTGLALQASTASECQSDIRYRTHIERSRRTTLEPYGRIWVDKARGEGRESVPAQRQDDGDSDAGAGAVEAAGLEKGRGE